MKVRCCHIILPLLLRIITINIYLLTLRTRILNGNITLNQHLPIITSLTIHTSPCPLLSIHKLYANQVHRLREEPQLITTP